MAAMNGHLATCEILLRSGISRDARTKVDKTPLHIAAQEGHTDIVELLLDNGADVDCQDLVSMNNENKYLYSTIIKLYLIICNKLNM